MNCSRVSTDWRHSKCDATGLGLLPSFSCVPSYLVGSDLRLVTSSLGLSCRVHRRRQSVDA